MLIILKMSVKDARPAHNNQAMTPRETPQVGHFEGAFLGADLSPF